MRNSPKARLPGTLSDRASVFAFVEAMGRRVPAWDAMRLHPPVIEVRDSDFLPAETSEAAEVWLHDGFHDAIPWMTVEEVAVAWRVYTADVRRILRGMTLPWFKVQTRNERGVLEWTEVVRRDHYDDACRRLLRGWRCGTTPKMEAAAAALREPETPA